MHLWWGNGEAVETLDSPAGWLSETELRRSERFRRERDARAFRFRRAFLRARLAAALDCAPAELVFVEGAHGKPALAWPASRLCFSATSSGPRVLVALSLGRELGVDLERLSALPSDAEELSGLARRILCAGELAELAGLAPSERRGALLRAWARKEAWLKALGVGLAREPDTVEARLAPGVGARVLADAAFVALGGARLVDLAAPTGHAASLVVAGDVRRPCTLRVHGS